MSGPLFHKTGLDDPLKPEGCKAKMAEGFHAVGIGSETAPPIAKEIVKVSQQLLRMYKQGR